MMDFVRYGLLPAVLNMTITASLLILVVLALRLLLRRAPKVFSYALWSVILFRLLCPVSLSSSLSLLKLASPPVEQITPHTATVSYVRMDRTLVEEDPAQQAPVSTQAVPAPAVPTTHAAPHNTGSAPPFPIGAWVYLGGVIALALYSALSLFLLRRRLVGAVETLPGVWLADHIDTPFVLGLLRPKVYLPSGLNASERAYILAHERFHIRRLDHLVKLLAFCALCLHWFNPLVWLAFFLSIRDMEMSCDEAVMSKMDRDVRADYSASLLRLSTPQRPFTHSPLAFGEGDPKGRVKNILRWKKPRGWVVLLAATLCVLLIAACATNPGDEADSAPSPSPSPATQKEDPAQTIARVTNAIFVGGLSWDESYQGPTSYTITAREQQTGRTDAYTCDALTFYSWESTPGQRLLDNFDWTAADVLWDPAAQLFPDFAGDYALRFETNDAAMLVSSGDDLLLLWEEGRSYAFVGTPRYQLRNDCSHLFGEFQDRAHSALYDHEFQVATSVDGGVRDYQAVAQELGKQYAAALADRPGWSPQQLEDCVFADANVFDAYYGEDWPNFAFILELYLKLTDDQVNWWQAGSGVEPVTKGPYAGWYRYAREAQADLDQDGSWHLRGLNTGGTSARLPANLETASAQTLAELYFSTAGHSHDYLIPYYFSQLTLTEAQSALDSLSEQHCRELTDGIVSFAHEYPDDCPWTREDLTSHSGHHTHSAQSNDGPYTGAHHSDAHH